MATIPAKLLGRKEKIIFAERRPPRETPRMNDPVTVLETLYTAVVADVLDSLGHRNQTLSADIRAMTSAHTVCGRVFTAKAEAVNEIPDEPYKLEMAAIDTMQAGDVLVVDGDHNRRCAFWGELLSTAAANSGCVGAIVDGCVRDIRQMREMSFPVFARGRNIYDSKDRQRVVDIDVPVEIDGVRFCSGDLVVADADGVVVVPAEIEQEAVQAAWQKVHAENVTRDAIKAGMKATDAYEKYGVL